MVDLSIYTAKRTMTELTQHSGTLFQKLRPMLMAKRITPISGDSNEAKPIIRLTMLFDGEVKDRRHLAIPFVYPNDAFS